MDEDEKSLVEAGSELWLSLVCTDIITDNAMPLSTILLMQDISAQCIKERGFVVVHLG